MERILDLAGPYWTQAGIQFDCDGVEPYPIEHANIPAQVDDLSNRFLPSATFDLVVFYLPRPNINGKPLSSYRPSGSRIVLISDTVDLKVAKPPPEKMGDMTGNTLEAAGRVCAHEIGHILLGSEHPSNPILLMYQGSKEHLLTNADKVKAKSKADELISLR